MTTWFCDLRVCLLQNQMCLCPERHVPEDVEFEKEAKWGRVEGREFDHAWQSPEWHLPETIFDDSPLGSILCAAISR